MSKVNNALVGKINRFLNKVNVKVLSYQEFKESEFYKEGYQAYMDRYQAFHNVETSLIMIDDDCLKDSTELVLHELIHIALRRANIELERHTVDEQALDTENAAAQIGILKLLMALDINPAPWEDVVLKYLKELPKVNFLKADRLSDVAVSYLMKQVRERKAA